MMQKSERENHMTYWRQSGQSKKAYSEMAGIKYATFISWFKAARKEAKKEQPGHFVKLEKEKAANWGDWNKEGMEIVFPNGIRLCTKESITIELLKSLHCV